MEVDPYYEPTIFFQMKETSESDEKEKKSSKVSSQGADEIEQEKTDNIREGWFVVKSKDYFFPKNVSEDLSRINEIAAELRAQSVAVVAAIKSQSVSAATATISSIHDMTPSISFRKRDSWNATFTSIVTTLRLVGQNPFLNTLSVPTLQLLTDQLSIPSWLPTLPPGVSSETSQHPSGEWFYPTQMGLKIRKNAQPDSMKGRYILYLHGGAFCCCHTGTHRGLLHWLVHRTGASILSVNYRRPPEHPYPTPIHDCLSAYLFLLEKVGDASQIFFAGDSAGGNLVINTLMLVAEHQLPQPSGAVLLSPWVDLTDNGRCSSWEEYKDIDYLSPQLAELFARSYAGDCQEVQNLSPLYSANLDHLPPLLVEFGQCEMLHDQIQAFCETAKIAGVDISYNARPDMVHVFPLYAFTGMKQCEDSFDEIVKFFDAVLSRHADKTFGEEREIDEIIEDEVMEKLECTVDSPHPGTTKCVDES